MASKTKQTEQVESFISPHSEYGLLRASTPDHTVWLYAEIPWGSALLDGANDSKRVNSCTSLTRLFDGLASHVSVGAVKYRSLCKSQYREFHILTGSIPVPFVSANPRKSDLARYQNRAYHDRRTQRQFAVVGVPLKPGGISHVNGRRPTRLQRIMTSIDRIAYSYQNGVPTFEEYLDDAHMIERDMLAAGLRPFTRMNELDRNDLINRMKSFWVSSNSGGALGVLPENDHIHLFPDVDTAKTAQIRYRDNIPCTEWNLAGEYPATICFAQGSQFSETPVSSAANQWIARLMEVAEGGGANAIGVSIRGIVEPATVTNEEIRRNTRTVNDSIREREKKGRDPSSAMEDILEKLDYKRQIYRDPNMPPTLINLSVAALVAGTAHQAIDALGAVPDVTFVNMNTRSEQLVGFKSMQACSPWRMTPYELQWTAPSVAGGGINSMAAAGDQNGALLGLTEANCQPVYISTTTVQDANLTPFFIFVAKPGVGKTMSLLSLAFQWSQIDARDGSGKTPVIFIDPKEDSDFTQAVTARGGTVYSMDSNVSNGTFDPLNVLQNEEEAAETASLMLSDILDPSGANPDLEICLKTMISYGVAHGAHCCGVAMKLAYDAYRAKQVNMPPMVDKVWEQTMWAVQTYQYLRIIFGTDNNVKPLKISHALTLIRAGKRSMTPSQDSGSRVTGRIQRWVLRMTVLGAGAAVRGRDGMVILDEAWVALGEGSGQVVEQWGRLARSQHFTPVLASQKVQEFVDAGLAGFVSRGVIMSLDDPDESNGTVSEARAALRLFQIDDSDGRIIHRMTLDATTDGGTPNWDSLRALTDPDDHKTVLRGTIGYFKDGSKLPVPVEMWIPKALIREISTNGLDMMERSKRNASRKADDIGL